MCCGLRPFDAALSVGIAYRSRIPEIVRACLVAFTFLVGLRLPVFGSFSTATACAALAAGFFAYSRLSKKKEEEKKTKKKARRGLCHDRWSAGKVPDRVDAIVIGSGMGGLTAAAILARAGKRVLVVEQHDVAGGGTHTFPLGPQGAYQFDSGLHYTYDRGTRTLSLCLSVSLSLCLSVSLSLCLSLSVTVSVSLSLSLSLSRAIPSGSLLSPVFSCSSPLHYQSAGA